MRVSIVTTMYRSAPYLAEFHARSSACARRMGIDVEFVYVNDGSPDQSLQVVLELRKKGGNIRVVDLSRNFGHHPAIMTGLAHATGDRIFLIDCDLEEAPELLETFWCRMEDTKVDVIYGVQAGRKDSLFSQLMAWGYYKVHTWLCSESIPENLMTVRLMSRRYLDALLSHREVDYVISGLWARTGFDQASVLVEKGRKTSSSYTLVKKLALLARLVTSVSAKPLFALSVFCVLCFGMSLLIVAGLLIANGLATGLSPDWLTMMISVWLLGGMILFSQGVLIVYLARVYLEVKHRPSTIIRQVHQPLQGTVHEQLARAG